MKTAKECHLAVLAWAALLSGCISSAAPPSSILKTSYPANGATIATEVQELKLHFNPPARLLEVTVEGPSGPMPMMITPAGESADYSLPLSGVGPGQYTVSWRATVGDAERSGTLTFRVKP